jgi:hypothetical protein
MLNSQSDAYLPWNGPIYASRAKQNACYFVVKTAIVLDFTTERGIKRLSGRGNPVDNGTLHSFSVVGAGSIHTSLNLQWIL